MGLRRWDINFNYYRFIEEEVALEYADFMKTAQQFPRESQYFDYEGRKIPIEYYDYLGEMIDRLQSWMTAKRFDHIGAFKGKMSQEKTADPSIYDRVQFMRYYGGKKNVVT